MEGQPSLSLFYFFLFNLKVLISTIVVEGDYSKVEAIFQINFNFSIPIHHYPSLTFHFFFNLRPFPIFRMNVMIYARTDLFVGAHSLPHSYIQENVVARALCSALTAKR